MNLDQLCFFNKEGYQINAELDPNGYWKSKLFFDKNSTNTYKTLALYTFEKTLATSNTLSAWVDKFQAFNTDGLQTWPNNDIPDIEILNITKTNTSAQFATKWIYIQTDARFIPGQWCSFVGLNGYAGTQFNDQIAGQIQVFQVLEVQSDRIMIRTSSFNNVTLPSFVPASFKKIKFWNCIEWLQNPILDPWQETSGMTKIYPGKKLQTIGTNNETIYTSVGQSTTKIRQRGQWSPTSLAFTPSVGDRLQIKINLFTDRFLLNTGVTVFAPIGFINDIQISYIPQFLKVGDSIIAEQKTVALLGPNTSNFTVTAIDLTSGRITVTPAPTLQTVDCRLYLATNQILIDQPIVLDNNNQLSIPVTYWSIVNQWQQILNGYDIGISYIPSSDSLRLEHLYSELYFTADISALNANAGLLTGPVFLPTINLISHPFLVQEPVELETVNDKTSLYSRKFVFNTIDSRGIRILINGIQYDADFDLNVANTVLDWITLWQTDLAVLGIQISAQTSLIPNDTILIEPDFPNRPIVLGHRMGDQSVWWIPYKEYQFVNIRSQLLITINGINYRTLFNVNDATTVANWLVQWSAELELLGIYTASPAPGFIQFRVQDPERSLQITYNIGYLPKSGDTSVVETDLAPRNRFQLVAGNELQTVPGTYNFLELYATGQKISVSGLAKSPQNGGYNIIGLNSNVLMLSYQGAFWQQGPGPFNIGVASDPFLQQPKQGLTGVNNRAQLVWSWKDTQISDMFLYDFSGDQLSPIYPGFPAYTGPKPLCGPNGEIQLKLNRTPNDDSNPDVVADPTKQQTVFDQIVQPLLFSDQSTSVLIEPSPLQTYIGYQSSIGSVSKARLYCSLVEDLNWSLETNPNLIDDVWIWDESSKSVTISSPSVAFDWQQIGFRPGQRISVNSVDINSDGRKLVSSLNQGKILTIDSVFLNKIVFKEDIITETSVKTIAKTTAPFYDSFGNQLTENRRLSITLTVIPKVVAYFDVFGESEEEDWRHQINLNNRNLNILKLQDFYIFKSVDINEQGVDWVFMNRKRKQLIEVYGDIFNNVSSYKAIINAIGFFGYTDLTFTEYFQNVDPDSKKYGQLFNMELLEAFNKLQPDWQSYSNLAVENLRNRGYKKTNLFSLNYMITDREGNFVNSYSLEEVQIKLNGLRRWLKENLVPIGVEIVDINGKWVQPVDWKIKHETYQVKTFNVEEYSTPIDFNVDGYILPISPGGNQYNISVKPFSAGIAKWFDITVKTFYLDSWLSSSIYYVNDTIYWKGRVWIATTNVAVGQEPDLSNVWTQHSFDLLPCNQALRDIRWNLNPFSFTINSNVDPHFQVEINWHSEYACTLTRKKTYSVIPDFFKDLK